MDTSSRTGHRAFHPMPVDVSSSIQQSMALTNSGTTNVTISNVSVSGSGFNASDVSAGTILARGQSTTLTATFMPPNSGNACGTITITSNASNGAKLIALSGTGTAALHSVTLSWSPSPFWVVGYNVYFGTGSSHVIARRSGWLHERGTPDAANALLSRNRQQRERVLEVHAIIP